MKKIIIGITAIMLCCGCSLNTPQTENNSGGSGSGSVSVNVKSTSKPKVDKDKVLDKLSTTAYTWRTKWGNYLALVIKNNSKTDCKLSVDVTFSDANKSTIGVTDDVIEAFGAGEEVCIVFDNDEQFENYEYKYSVSDLDYFNTVVSDLTCEATTAKDKVIVTATNNGNKTAEFVTATALFMNGDKVVNASYRYLGDDDSEIKPGSKESEEIHCFDNFDNVKVYLSGYSQPE